MELLNIKMVNYMKLFLLRFVNVYVWVSFEKLKKKKLFFLPSLIKFHSILFYIRLAMEWYPLSLLAALSELLMKKLLIICLGGCMREAMELNGRMFVVEEGLLTVLLLLNI